MTALVWFAAAAAAGVVFVLVLEAAYWAVRRIRASAHLHGRNRRDIERGGDR